MSLTNERRERAFRESLSFDQFVNSMQVNQANFVDNYKAFQLTETDKAFFNALSEPVEVLVLAHDWCGDVVANTPLFGKIEQETGKLHLHLLLRDPDNTDIAAAYPHHDGRNHIPTYIFYNGAGDELGVFIERPDNINELLHGWLDTFFDTHPELDGKDKSIGELSSEAKAALLPYLQEQRRTARQQEQAAIIEAIKGIVRLPALA